MYLFITLATTLPIMFAVFAFTHAMTDDTPPNKTLIATLALIGLTAFLWCPWVNVLYQMNVAKASHHLPTLELEK